MSDNGNYFTFPLAVLHAGKSPLRCIDLAINCGMLSAGKGFRHLNDNEDFEEKIEKICEEQNIGKTARPGSHTEAAEILVGSSICNVTLGRHSRPHLESLTNLVARVPKDGAFVRMKSDFIWPALEQARAEEQPASPWPGKGISWREWRILAAILSVRRNRADFAFIGWETIQARACGFTTKKGLRDAESIPDHLSPSLSRRQIRDTTDQLENLGFYARSGFQREDVEDSWRIPSGINGVNWPRRFAISRTSGTGRKLRLTEPRTSANAWKCWKGPSPGQGLANKGTKVAAKVRANIMRNALNEKCF